LYNQGNVKDIHKALLGSKTLLKLSYEVTRGIVVN